jgi:uncharacterized protein
MSNQYYLATKGVQKSVEALISILKKVNQTEGGKPVFDARIAPDMFGLNKQVTVVSDNLKGMVSRFTVTENPKMEDTETNLDELIVRLQKTVDFANSIAGDKYQDAANIKAVLPWMPGKYLTADDYLFQFAIPNVYFHLSIAYAILRNNGYELGKQDFLGGLNLQDLG